MFISRDSEENGLVDDIEIENGGGGEIMGLMLIGKGGEDEYEDESDGIGRNGK